MSPVREIEARHIHPGSQQLLQDRNLSGLRPQSTYDLGFRDVKAAVIRRIPKYVGDVNLHGHCVPLTPPRSDIFKHCFTFAVVNLLGPFKILAKSFSGSEHCRNTLKQTK